MGLLSKWVSPPRDRNSTRENISAPGSFVASAWGFLRRGTACFAPTRCVIFSQVYGCRILFSLFAVSQSIGYKIHERSAMSRPTHSCEAGDRAREGGGRGRPCVRDEGKNPTGERRRRRRIDSSSAVFNSFPLLTPTRFIAETTQRERERERNKERVVCGLHALNQY